MNRKNLIDGLPNSYDTYYVIKTNKHCECCIKPITNDEIEQNQIICTDTFDFYHKECLINEKIEYEHYNSKDKSSPIVLKQKK